MSINIDHIAVRCGCGNAFRVKPAAEGRSVRCPKCKTPNLVRRTQEAAEATIPSLHESESDVRDSPNDSGGDFPIEDSSDFQLDAAPEPTSHFTPPPQPKTSPATSVAKKPRFDVVSFIARSSIVLLFAAVLLSLVFTIFHVLGVLAGADYVFKDEFAPGYSANQLRGIREDLAFFKLLVLVVLVERTFTRMVRSFRPQPSSQAGG